MGIRKTRVLPGGVEGVQRRFERWRRIRKIPSRIPEPLWASAVRMAGTYGISRAAKMLRVNYNALKQRVEQGGAAAGGFAAVPATVPKGSAVAGFVELASPVPAGACECTLDLENAGGAKMRVQLKSITMPDLAALSRSFWNHQP